MDEQEIFRFMNKVMTNPQMSVSAAEAKLLVACQDWLEEKLDGEEEQQSA